MSSKSTATSLPSAAVLGAGQEAPIAVMPQMVGAAVGQSGSKEVLARFGKAVNFVQQRSVMKLLQKALLAVQKEDWKTAGELAIKALNIDEKSGYAWYVLGVVRERANDFANSLRCFETALKLLPDELEVANDLGRLAYRMGMKDTAEKLFRHYLSQSPFSHEGANNLACAVRDQRRFEDAIEVLRPAIQMHPEIPLLWNTLGTVLAEQGEPVTSTTFFDEALRLDPTFTKARYNRGNARLQMGDPAGALEDCEEAMTGLSTRDEFAMMKLARASILAALGRVADSWEAYEIRLDHVFPDALVFATERPRWRPGEDLRGKTVLLFGEQGLGDEVMFANIVPDLLEAVGPEGRVVFAVQLRLVSLFQRSFPTAIVGAHANGKINGRIVRGAKFFDDMTQVDYWAPLASMLQEFRPTVESFPERERFLVPDPERVAYWREQLEALPGAKVGLVWKSLIQNSSRHRFYSPFQAWKPVLRTPGVTFVNLQYGDCAEELEMAKRELGVEIWNPPGIDLKNDLDDVAALTRALDLVVGPANATTCLAGATGAPLWLIVTNGSWTMLGTERYPWYPQARVFTPAVFGDWQGVMADIARAVSETFATGTKVAAAG